jgi:hypothetical protein
MRVFAVARMSPLILGLTGLLLALPPVFLGLGLLGDGPAAGVLLAAGLFVTAIYAWVWLVMRPGSYWLDDTELVLAAPLRRLRVPRHDVVDAEVLDLDAFRARYGHTIRIGAGGLFGAFGWLWSRKAGRLDVYVTNLGPWVVVERRAGRPLVLSPADPHAFARALADSD